MTSVSLNACRMLFIIFYVFCRQDMPIKEHNSLLCFIMMLYLACYILGTGQPSAPEEFRLFYM